MTKRFLKALLICLFAGWVIEFGSMCFAGANLLAYLITSIMLTLTNRLILYSVLAVLLFLVFFVGRKIKPGYRLPRMVSVLVSIVLMASFASFWYWTELNVLKMNKIPFIEKMEFVFRLQPQLISALVVSVLFPLLVTRNDDKLSASAESGYSADK